MPRSKHGFGLIEVMVAGVLLAGVMFAAVSLMQSFGRSQKSASQAVDFDSLTLLVRMSLQNATTCPTALQTATGAPVTAPASVTVATPNLPASGIPVSKISIGSLTVDTTVPYNGLYIQSIALLQSTVGSPDIANPQPYVGTLHLEGSKTAPGAKAAVGGGVLRKDIPISFTIKGSTIVACDTSTDSGAPSTGPTFITPVVVAVCANDINWVYLNTIAGAAHLPFSTWTKVTPSVIPPGKSYAKLNVLTGSMAVYIAGRGQSKVAPAQRKFYPGLAAGVASAGTANSSTYDVPLESDGSFYVYVDNYQPNVGLAISVYGYE